MPKRYLVAVVFCLTAVLFSSSRAGAETRPFTPRIYGGGKSTATHSVGLLVESMRGKPYVFFCSGTFLSSTHFLTAKHCLSKNGFTRPVFTVYSSKRGAGIKVRAKVSSRTDDISVLTLAPSSSVVPVPILVSRVPVFGETVEIDGYGKDQRERSALDSGTTHYLKYGTASLVSITAGFFSFVNTPSGGLCHGDSGGPMFALNAEQQPGMIGVASFFRGPDRCRAGNQGSYVNIQSESALNFILANAPEAALN